MILILPIPKIFDNIYIHMLVTWYVDYIKHFLTYFANKFCENRISTFFLAANRFSPILCVYFQYVQNFKVALTL